MELRKQFSLKNKIKKHQVLDAITNERIKSSHESLIKNIQKIFNQIFNSGYFPEAWSHNLIFSIYKSGKKDDAINYRGTNLYNCLGKFFNTILYKRVEKFGVSTNLENIQNLEYSGKYFCLRQNLENLEN